MLHIAESRGATNIVDQAKQLNKEIGPLLGIFEPNHQR
jgi:hypothetical protein